MARRVPDQAPEDVPVWRAWLNLGIATNRSDIVGEAMRHLPATEFNAAERHRLSALLCSGRGDVECEYRELESLLAVAPADLTALDRLAQIAEKGGQRARTAELHRQKAEIDRLNSRYMKLYERNQSIRDAEEMAALAEKLGRHFEARVFLTLAIADEPDRQDLRHERPRMIQNHGIPAHHPFHLREGPSLRPAGANARGGVRPR